MSIKGKVLRYIYWTSDFFKGRPIRCQYDDIKKILENNEQGTLLRSQYLTDILQYAVKHTAYYKNISSDDLFDSFSQNNFTIKLLYSYFGRFPLLSITFFTKSNNC